MKYVITICLVGVMLISTGNVYAGGGQNQDQGQGQGQAQGQGQIATADNENIVVNSMGFEYSPVSTYVERTGVINPGYPALPWLMPQMQQISLWNALGCDPRFLEREWTMDECRNMLKHVRIPGPLEFIGALLTGGAKNGGGFEWTENLTCYDYKPASSVQLKLAQNAPFEVIQKDYTFFGEINVKGLKSRTFLVTVAFAKTRAMKRGADLVVLSGGMNVIYNGTSFSPGAGFGTAGVHNSFSLIGGLNSGDAKAQGEPSVKLTVFRKNGTGIEMAVKPEEKEGKKEDIPEIRVSPEILEKAAGMK